MESKYAIDVEAFVWEVVKEHDWVMPQYSAKEYDNYSEYECECFDIGHDYEYDVAENVVERMIKAGQITQEQVEELSDVISELVWDTIVLAIRRNMSEED